QRQQGLQVGLPPEHLLDEGDQLLLAAPRQGRPQFLRLGEILRLVAPGQEEGGDVLAVAPAADGAGTFRLRDALAAQRHLDGVSFVARALDAALQGQALAAGVEDGTVLEVTLAQGEAALADALPDGLVGNLGRRAHGSPRGSPFLSGSRRGGRKPFYAPFQASPSLFNFRLAFL